MAYQNKILTNGTIPRGKLSRDRWNREYMISPEIAESLNTYRTHGIFPTNNDVGVVTWDEDTKETTNFRSGLPGVQSLFNKYSAVLTGGNIMVSKGATRSEQASAMSQLVTGQNGTTDFRFSNNTPLLDSPKVREQLEENSACSVKDLVQASAKGVFGRCVYSYSDFMYCKHLGKVPNNYMITLRRFPVPVTDAMMPVGRGRRNRNDPTNSAKGASPVGTMITWMGVSDNNMEDILNYSYTMPFEEKTADWQQVNNLGSGQTTTLNGIATLMNPASRQAWANGTRVPAIDSLMGKFGLGEGVYERQGDHWDSNKIYGPIDRIKKNYRRGSDGIDWTWDFSLTFEYELRAYNGINPKQAMLDLIANILAVTYTNGEFWKGGYYGFELGTTSQYQNMDIFKTHGSFTGWMNTLTNTLTSGAKSASGEVQSSVDTYGFAGSVKRLLNSVGAIDLVMSGLLNKLGRPERYAYPSLLSESPVGLWHITIGNPRRPIIVAGNMIIKSTTITHSGPLGLDDFPEQLKVKIDLTRGKPRDIYGIEALYMKGNDRIFHSMSKAVMDMYDAAITYKGGGSNGTDGKFDTSTTNIENALNQAETGSTNIREATQTTIINDVVLEAFGDPDTDAIVMSAAEQAEGYFNSLDYVENTEDVNGVSSTAARSGMTP